MNEILLFSPVGGTDPISNRNLHDGSMLHICRVYKPTKVILYMSKEILALHKKDNRYFYCLDRLAEQQNRTMAYQVIERPKLKNVQEFDYFYQDFRSIIEETYKGLDESDTLLLNISSGTPAMKSGLLVLQTLGEFPCRMIQVITPERQMNTHVHDGFDPETAWELNEDNKENFVNRCEEVQCPTLSVIKKEEIIKKHIQVYDYRAAVAVAETIPEEYRKNYHSLLKIAESRILLDFPTTDKLLKNEDYNCLPVRESGKRKCFEYALSLQIKLLRGEYADFIRAITPLVVDLLEMALKSQCKIDINSYTKTTVSKKNPSKTPVRKWDKKKLENTAILDELNKHFYNDFKKDGMISSSHLKALIQSLSKNMKFVNLTEDLRHVEDMLRNMAAHEIVSVTADTIVKQTGFTGEQIMSKIKEMFTYTGINATETAWESYNAMNQEILRRISPEGARN